MRQPTIIYDPFGRPARRAVLVERISEVLIYCAAFAAVLLFLVKIGTAQAQTAPTPTPAAQTSAQATAATEALVRPGDAGFGSLLLKSVHDGLYVEAPRVASDVETTISGPIIRTVVTQRFYNPSDQWTEGVYVFPLPDDAAVDAMKVLIGDRVIEGQIKERGEARRIYEQARQQGYRASLVEQERPNIFTNSVANIGPGETVAVQIEYQASARFSDGAFSMRFPLVVAPRYSPPPEIVQTVDFDGSGWGVDDPVPDRDRISPPVIRPGENEEETTEPTFNSPVTMKITLAAGFPIDTIESAYHEINIRRRGRDKAEITLKDGAIEANKDLELVWRPVQGSEPRAALFRETIDGDGYVLAMITPPAGDAEDRPREAVYVIDTSGSMSGPSIDQARTALLMALDRLEADDTFNIIRFDSDMDMLFRQSMPANDANLRRAAGYVKRMVADGGTEMLPALQAALVDISREDPEGDAARLRQVIFLTDGAIGNEAQLFAAIDAGLGRSRLFTVGIGSAPNSYFMSRAARLGRGTFTHIGDVAQVAERMTALFDKLERPVMTDLVVALDDDALAETWPNPLPDLYAGEPVIVTVKAGAAARGKLKLSGRIGEQAWRSELPLARAVKGDGVSKLWARRKIAAIEESRFSGAAQERINAQVLATALEYDLVSRLTSLVAVDVTPARPDGEPLAQRDVPVNLPDGWDFEKVFGEDNAAPPAPRQRTWRDARADTQLLALAASPAPGPAREAEAAADTAGLALPATALGVREMALIGLLAWGLAFLLLSVHLSIRKDGE